MTLVSPPDLRKRIGTTLETDPGAVLSSRRLEPTPVEFGWIDRHPNALVMLGIAVFFSMALGAAVAIKPKIAIVVVVAAALLLAVLHRPAIGGYVLAGVVPVTSGLRSGFPIPGFRVSEVLIGAVSVAILIPAAPRQSLRWRTFDWLFAAYAVTALVFGLADSVSDHVPLTGALIGTLFGPMQFVLLYRAVAVSLPLRAQRNIALRCLLLGSVPVSILAVMQQLRIAGINNFIVNITGSSVTVGTGFLLRATGPFDHWTPLAGYLLVILILIISLLLHGVEQVLPTKTMFLLLGLDALGLLLTAELSAMIALVPMAVILGVWSGKLQFLLRWGLAVVVALAVSFGWYFQERLNTEFAATAGSGRAALVPQTIQFRWQVWTQQYIPAIREQLLWGYGPTLPSSVVWPDTESQYITFLMWGGIPLLLVFIGMMWSLFSRARAMSTPSGDDPARWAMARAVTLLVVATYFIDLVFPYLTSSGLPQVLFVLVGILVATDHTRRDRDLRVSDDPFVVAGTQ